MASLEEYFHADFVARPAGGRGTISSLVKVPDADMTFAIDVKRVEDLDVNARFLMIYVPPDVPEQMVARAFDLPDIQAGDLPSVRGGGGFISVTVDGHAPVALAFTKKVFLYIDEFCSTASKRVFLEAAAARGLSAEVRDRQWALDRTSTERPLGFISHDSRDKDLLVRPLAHELVKTMCPVWYDEYSLKVGDNLRESIEKGINETNRCILIISKEFIANGGWAKREFESVFIREIYEETNLILPVWHKVTGDEVRAFCSWLPNRVAANSSLGIPLLASKLAEQLRTPLEKDLPTST